MVLAMTIFERRLNSALRHNDHLLVEQILLEKRHKYASTQVNIDGMLKRRLVKFVRSLPKGLLSDDGIEDKPHITCKYGINSNDEIDKLKDALEGFGEFTVTLGKTERFQSDESDVLKISVTGRRLHDLHKLIGKTVKCTDKYRSYVPHLTLAYMKPGTSEDWLGLDDFDGKKIKVTEIVFSDKDRHHTPISLA